MKSVPIINEPESTGRFVDLSISHTSRILERSGGAHLIVLILGIMFTLASVAQEAAPEGEVEGLYEELDRTREAATPADQAPGAPGGALKESAKLQDLSELAPPEDIAVIQRKFLPKTYRFDFSLGALASTNNAFFTNIGGGANLGFGFSERWGVELGGLAFTDSKKQITTSLEEKANVSTRSLVIPQRFVGGWLRWMPIYGKMALFDRKIIPYDFYLKAGAGQTATQEDSAAMTMSLGVGQIFAFSKSRSYRWEFIFNSYSATVRELVNSQETINKISHSDLLLSFSVNFYFPGAKYR